MFASLVVFRLFILSWAQTQARGPAHNSDLRASLEFTQKRTFTRQSSDSRRFDLVEIRPTEAVSTMTLQSGRSTYLELI